MEVTFQDADIQVVLLTYQYDREEVERVISLFEEIAIEQSWQPDNQLRAYPTSSVYFALYISGELAGALQLVVGNSEEGLPCLTVWPELNLYNRTDVADVALMAFGQKYRGSRKLFWLVCIEMWRFCVNHNIVELWVEASPRIIEIEKRLGWPLQIAGPLRHHWEEASYPCRMSVATIAEIALARAQKSQQYEKITQQIYR
ncbi:hypothetical protein NUACC21_63240 [Scytonema sp. NUACC21]